MSWCRAGGVATEGATAEGSTRDVLVPRVGPPKTPTHERWVGAERVAPQRRARQGVGRCRAGGVATEGATAAAAENTVDANHT